MNATSRPVCKVCHRPLHETDQYLIRFDGSHATAVHRSLCFPPARVQEPKPVQRAA